MVALVPPLLLRRKSGVTVTLHSIDEVLVLTRLVGEVSDPWDRLRDAAFAAAERPSRENLQALRQCAAATLD